MKSDGEWGEFFPARLSPFAYNESTVGEYYPLTKEEAISAGYVWKDSIPEQRGTENARIVDIAPDDRYDWQKISGLIFACDTCQRNFRFIEREVTFYKRIGVALPKSCFFCRHQNRMNKRLERRLFHRRCSCNVEHHGHEGSCSNEFETSYAPDRPEIVYCESCYQKEVI